MQTYAVAPPAHEMDLPAAVAAAPGVTLRLATFADGYVTVHSSAAGSLPAGEDMDRLRATVLPPVAVADESVKLDWAQTEPANAGRIAVRNHILDKRSSFPGLTRGNVKSITAGF